MVKIWNDEVNSRQSPSKHWFGEESKQLFVFQVNLNFNQLTNPESVTKQLSKNNQKHQASRMVSSNESFIYIFRILFHKLLFSL